MTANRLIRMIVNRLMRQGIKRLSADAKPDPRLQQARKSLKVTRRIGRL